MMLYRIVFCLPFAAAYLAAGVVRDLLWRLASVPSARGQGVSQARGARIEARP